MDVFLCIKRVFFTKKHLNTASCHLEVLNSCPEKTKFQPKSENPKHRPNAMTLANDGNWNPKISQKEGRPASRRTADASAADSLIAANAAALGAKRRRVCPVFFHGCLPSRSLFLLKVDFLVDIEFVFKQFRVVPCEGPCCLFVVFQMP